MTFTVEEKRAALRPLVERLCVSHCWRDHWHVAKPFGAREVNEHLAGAHKYGLCPIAPGESTCRVALLDMDSHKGEVGWEEMVAMAGELALALRHAGHAPHLWRSSGGQGIHLILTWEAPQDAYTVREMLREVLEANTFRAGTGGVVKGEIEIFPKQDEVPADGFGNMFVLPWAGKSEPL